MSYSHNKAKKARRQFFRDLHQQQETELYRLALKIEQREAEIAQLKAQVAELEKRFACGHRVKDWDNGYGECVACIHKQCVIDYDKLPHTVIECHDQIGELQSELAKLRNSGSGSDD